MGYLLNKLENKPKNKLKVGENKMKVTYYKTVMQYKDIKATSESFGKR